MTRRSWVRAAVVLALGGLLAGRWAAVAAADRLWAESLGVRASHAAIADLKLTMLLAAFSLAAVWSLGNLYLVYRTIGSVHVPRRLGNLEIVEAVPRRYLLFGTGALGLAIALVVSHGATSWWSQVALLGSRTSLPPVDPVLHHDLAYYLFRLPWLRTLHQYAATLSSVMLVVVGALYGLVGAIRAPHRRLVVADWARGHLGALLVVFALTLAAGFRLDPAEYLAGLRNVPYDAVLLSVRLPVSRLLAGVAWAVALTSLVWIWVDRAALVVVPWVTLAALGLVGTFVLPGFSAAVRGPERLAVPELVTAQRGMLSVAYGLPASDTTIAPPASPSPDLVRSRASEIALTPIWNQAALTDLLNRTAAQRSYQRFAGVALDLYRARDGRPAPLYVAPRETDLLAAREADPAMSWASVHAGAYHHASGAVAVPAAQASATGLPLFVPDPARPDSAGPQPADLNLASPDVFFSPSAEEYAIVAPRAGQAGIAPVGLARRLALAWTLQSPRLLSAQAVPAGAMVLWRRAITERLNRYAPFARFGAPYAVVAERRLLWLAWGYVAAEAFPLSVAAEWRGNEVRYLRTSLLGVVDAENGATAVYQLADPDPLSAAWAVLAPDVVRPLERLPRGLRQHVRYPDELFAAQLPLAVGGPPAGQPLVRRLPSLAGVGRAAEPSRPVWLVGTFPGDDTTRLRVRAVAERGDPAMLAAVADGHVEETRPVLRVARFAEPLAQLGPSQFAARTVNGSDPAGAGTGPVVTLVFAGGVVMLRSLFSPPGPEGGIPQLQEVVAGAGDAVGRGAGPAAAVRDLVAASRLTGSAPADWAQARQWFRRLDAARRAGDWAAFGRAYQQLRRLLASPQDSVP